MKVTIEANDDIKIQLDRHIEAEALGKLLSQAMLPGKTEIKLWEEEWDTLKMLQEEIAFKLETLKEEE